MNPSDQAVYSELGALGEISSTLAVCIVLVVHSEAVRELIVVPTSEDDLQHDKSKKYIGRMSIVVLTRSGPALESSPNGTLPRKMGNSFHSMRSGTLQSAGTGMFW